MVNTKSPPYTDNFQELLVKTLGNVLIKTNDTIVVSISWKCIDSTNLTKQKSQKL